MDRPNEVDYSAFENDRVPRKLQICIFAFELTYLYLWVSIGFRIEPPPLVDLAGGRQRNQLAVESHDVDELWQGLSRIPVRPEFELVRYPEGALLRVLFLLALLVPVVAGVPERRLEPAPRPQVLAVPPPREAVPVPVPLAVAIPVRRRRRQAPAPARATSTVQNMVTLRAATPSN